MNSHNADNYVIISFANSNLPSSPLKINNSKKNHLIAMRKVTARKLSPTVEANNEGHSPSWRLYVGLVAENVRIPQLP